MIFSDFFKALEQLGDKRFRKVLVLGIGLTLGLFLAIYLAFATLIAFLFPDSFYLPVIGEITWVKNAVSWAAIPIMIALSTFLMVPVASAFTSLFWMMLLTRLKKSIIPICVPQNGFRFWKV